MVTRGSQTLTWDHENRLASVTGGRIYPSESYLYDADSMRVKKTSDGKESYYPFPHYELHDGTVVKYYFFGGMRVAQRRDGVLTYLHGNHLGSSVLETNTSGVMVNDEKYFAYGEQRDVGPVNTENQYTDQKRDDTGLYYYGARYYDPALGTFVSPDSIVPEPTNVFDYNRMMYTRGNPLRFIDPSGHVAVCFRGAPNLPGKDKNVKHSAQAILDMCTQALTSAGWNEEQHGEILLYHYNGEFARFDAREAILSRPVGEPAIVIGHSWGGAAAMELVHDLGRNSGYWDHKYREGASNIDLLITIDTEWFVRANADNTIPENVEKAVNIAPVDGWEPGGEDGIFNAQNGTNEFAGALNIDLEFVTNPETGRLVRMDHDTIVNLNADIRGKNPPYLLNPVTSQIMSLYVNETLYGSSSYLR